MGYIIHINCDCRCNTSHVTLYLRAVTNPTTNTKVAIANARIVVTARNKPAEIL